MAENCQNCNETIIVNFCANCGQKKYKRIDRKYILDEFQSAVLDLNKGFLYSVKNILKNPGKTAKEFIEGNRINHYKPILLVFVLSGLSTFLSFKVLNLKEVLSTYISQQQMHSNFMGDLITFISSYNSIVMLLLVPIFALITKIAFRKWGDNYYEHVVMNAFGLSFYTLISIFLVYPIMFIFRDSSSISYNILNLSSLLVPFIMVWFFKEYYKDKPLKSVILKVLRVLGLIILGIIIFMLCAGIFSVILIMLKGPESLPYITPQ